LAEVLEYDLDGVILGYFSHCDGLSGEDRCAFGYNPVVVEEYEGRHYVDPLNEEVEPHELYALHGEGFTEFVRGASELARSRGKRFLCATRTDGIHGWGGKTAGGALVGATMRRVDLRDGKSDVPLAAGFYLETEKWVAEELVDGLLCHAPFANGVEEVRQLRDRVDVPCYLWRKFTGWEGNVADRPLEDFQDEAQAARDGEIDGYCLLIMQIVDHPSFQPDWTAIFEK